MSESHECYNHYVGTILRVESDGLGFIERNFDKQIFPFTFDKIYGYRGEYPAELIQFGPKGLAKGALATFTLDLKRKIHCVHFVERDYETVREAFINLRVALRTLLSQNGVPSNPAVEDEWIICQLRQLITKTEDTK